MMSAESDQILPPDDLEDRIVARLHEAGLLHPSSSSQEDSMKGIHVRWALASVVLVAMGVWAGTHAPQTDEMTVNPSAASDTRTQYALMLYQDAGYEDPPEGKEDERVAEYSAWARKLASQGHLVDGGELSGHGVLLRRDLPRTETIPAGSEGLLAGYFMIRAESLAEAERIAADCPHLTYGGSVSVRAVGS